MEGQLISDRYRLVRLLGKGGMGSVWLAEHTALKNEVAIKLISSDLGKVAQLRARFLREAQLAARIKSTHVVQVHDYGVSDDQPYIAMEYLVGMTLRDRLDKVGKLGRTDTGRVVSHVCRALTKAHEAGLVHRDLKPENIFLVKESDDEIIKVLDFGVAKAADALADEGIDPTRTGALVGTPFYMSPEQAQGLKTVDHRADLWAVGVLVYECLTGRRPFAGNALGPLIASILTGPIPPPSSKSPDVSAEVDSWMARALARSPSQRFASAQELAESFMVAAGTTESFRRDQSTRDFAAASALSPAAATLDSTVGGKQDNPALAATVSLDTPTGDLKPTTGTVRMDNAPPRPPSRPVPSRSAAPAVVARASLAPSRTPWVVAVVLLVMAVAVLGALLALKR